MDANQMDWVNPYRTARTPVFGANVVATSQPLATQAGIRILLRGGNAADAAIATAITLTVVEPTMNGVGSDAFALVWDGQMLHALNASGRAPRAWSAEQYAGVSEMPATGWQSVTVPGAVSSWIALSRKFGILPFAELFQPAIEYARDGFPVSPFIATTWAQAAEKYRQFPSYVDTFLPGGRPPRAGEIFRWQEFGDTLAEIAETFGESFYRGRLGAVIADFSRQSGGLLDAEDLASHVPAWVEPLSMDFGDYTLHEMPPNSQGIAALLALALLRGSRVQDLPPDSAESVDLQVRAMYVAHSDVRAHVADPEYMNRNHSWLLSETHVAELRGHMEKWPDAPTQGCRGTSNGDTVYLTAADSSGMMVSFIQSNYFDFGSGLVVPETGISLHSRGACFSLEPGHPNEVAGGKLPFHTLCPAFVSSGGRPVMSFGVMGGPMQPQGHVQVFLRVCAHRQNPQAACDAPRWHVAADGSVLLEQGFPESTYEDLRRRGHRVQRLNYGDPVFGGGQMALSIPRGYCAASDPRKDGQAAAF